MLALLIFLVVLFATLLYAVERGDPCYVGDEGCVPPSGAVGLVPGDRVLINKEGDLSSFSDVFYGLWYSFVTLTTVGYGDVVPVTNAGRMMSIMLMLLGSFYLAMPLTAVGSTFFAMHQEYQKKKDAGGGEAAQSILSQSGDSLPRSPTPASASASSRVTFSTAAMLLNSNKHTTAKECEKTPSLGDELDRKMLRKIDFLLLELAQIGRELGTLYGELVGGASTFRDVGQGTEFDECGEYGEYGALTPNPSALVWLGKGGWGEGGKCVGGRSVPVLRRMHTFRIASTRTADGSKDGDEDGNELGGSQVSDASSQIGVGSPVWRLARLLLRLQRVLEGTTEEVLRVGVMHLKTRRSAHSLPGLPS
mmetsp:Transcript_3920/g.8935  ORF Transcript_3920/g.8935 Transcript_3920/m.8935 type:complete len:364 (+) Transcript_3920:88-1179(+)